PGHRRRDRHRGRRAFRARTQRRWRAARRGGGVVKPACVHRQRSRVVFGLFVIAFGVAALLQNLGFVPPDLLQTWWPLVFVGLGAVRLVQRPGAHAGVFSIGLITLGAAMIASNLGVIHFHARDWWPLLVIFIGASL